MSNATFRIKDFPILITTTYKSWLDKDPFKLSAAVAYYAILSLPALLLIILEIVGAIWGREIVQGQLTDELVETFGADTAGFIRELMTKTGDTPTSLVAAILGIGTLVYGSTGVFYQLQSALDAIWEAKPKYSNSILSTLFGRMKSFGFILIFGFLLLISLVLTAGFSAFSERINDLMPDGFLEMAYLFDTLFSFIFTSFLFAAMFKFLPSATVRWKAVGPGAALTAILFVMGKYILAFYFAQAEPGSTYGAAGSVILVMVWVSYTSLILFFGAQFTKVFSDRYGLSDRPGIAPDVV